MKIDRDKNLLKVSPLFSWREDVFVKTFAADGRTRWPNLYADRTGDRRARVSARLRQRTRVSDDEQFQMKYGDFDWRLNNLNGGRSGDRPLLTSCVAVVARL